MNNDELNELSNLIWSDLNCRSNDQLNRIEQIRLIKSRLMVYGSESRRIGRAQILNYIQSSIDALKAE